MSNARLIWITPDAEKHIMYCARVSSPHQDSGDTGLLKYCVREKHWSVFEMASACFEIETTRAISPQILRHRSFSFQEFSQRYAECAEIERSIPRRQDTKNRQNSIADLTDNTLEWWKEAQERVNSTCMNVYKIALARGIAKECARELLPLATKTKMYMSGTIRSWLHYLSVRTDKSTQLEHRVIAEQILKILRDGLPTTLSNDVSLHRLDTDLEDTVKQLKAEIKQLKLDLSNK